MGSRILFVEDEDSAHFGVQEFLGAMGYVVDCVRDAAEAFERLAATRYAAAIVDLRLSHDPWRRGEMEGFAIVERLRREHPGTRVLVLTACGQEFEVEARQRGADCFLQKPQPLHRLAAVLETLCRGEP